VGLSDSPSGDFKELLRRAQALELSGSVPEAVAAYDDVIAANPGHAYPFTRRAMLLFRAKFGPPVPARAQAADAPRLTMSTLGQNGRFGNQLLQYGFLRMYAAEHGLALEAPDWIGRDLFDLDDPPRGAPLPGLREDQADFVASLNRGSPQVFRDTDLLGYCCYPTGGLRRHRELFRSLYRPGRKVAAIAASAESRLRARGDTLVAIHLRRGDFGHGQFWIAPAAWYAVWLEKLWPALQRPVLYVATDDAATAKELARFAPLSAADLKLEVPGAEFYPDFHLLTQADALAVSNSSFSFVAAMLNARSKHFMRPHRGPQALVGFDPWNAPVFLQA
jgi:hypothetical protein